MEDKRYGIVIDDLKAESLGDALLKLWYAIGDELKQMARSEPPPASVVTCRCVRSVECGCEDAAKEGARW